MSSHRSLACNMKSSRNARRSSTYAPSRVSPGFAWTVAAALVLVGSVVACSSGEEETSPTDPSVEDASELRRRRARDAGTPVTSDGGGGAACTPQCTGKSCGSDGCGGSCGSCAAGQTCGASGTCSAPSGGITHGSQIDASNTGPQGPLTPASGDINITTPGTVFEGKDLNGSIWVQADNVTIRNCKIHMSGGYYNIRNDGKNLLVENCEIYSDTPATAYTGIAGGDMVVRRNDIHHFENNITVDSNATVEENYLHDLAGGATAHPDGIEYGSSADNTVIRRNRITLSKTWGVGCVNVGPYNNGKTLHTVVQDNLFAGGTYSLYIRGDYGTLDDVLVSGNVWGRDSYQYGTHSVQYATNVKWSNNSFQDGTPVAF